MNGSTNDYNLEFLNLFNYTDIVEPNGKQSFAEGGSRSNMNVCGFVKPAPRDPMLCVGFMWAVIVSIACMMCSCWFWCRSWAADSVCMHARGRIRDRMTPSS